MRHVPRRRYAERKPEQERGRLTDVDSAERAHKLRAAWYSLAGGLLGSMAGSAIGIGGLLGFVLGWGLMYAAVVGIMKGAGRVASTIYAPSGKSTPRGAEYSEAQALAAQGRYAEAVAAYEIAAAESAGDPMPYIEIARIQRDHLGDFESAAAWFRRARRDATLGPGQELLVAQELIELYTKRLREPRRAIPELARIPHLVPGTPQAEAAERELAALRAGLGADGSGDAPGN